MTIVVEDAVWQVPHDVGGLVQLCVQLAAVLPALIVMEATGSLKNDLAVAQSTACHAVVVVNPRQVRHFPHATG